LELGGAKVGFEKERCPLCMEDDADKHPNLMFKCLEIKKWREYFVGKIGSAFSACFEITCNHAPQISVFTAVKSYSCLIVNT
jgi:hypothetical protein